ncbi:hypothetical protein C8R44DRAFT_192933 [Mycena epipterygia]|nr:hypothetical protein C8R44DRAFT_192933 [Mycena epipterygia]
MSNGWTRFQACNVLPGELISREIHFDHFTTWLVQANHIFHRVQIKSNRENCLFMHSVQYQLAFSPTGRDPPAGYLFVCPMDRTEIHNGTRLRFPDHPAYWSLNPSGREHLSAEEARCLGFPHIELTVLAFGRSWDDNVYAGLSQFHRGKGFNPDSQDIARHLRYPLYLLSEDAHSTEEATGNGDDLPASNAPVFAVDREIFEFLPEDCSDLTEFPTPTHEGDTRIYRLYAAEIFPPSHDWKIVTGVKFGLILGLSLIQLKNCVHVAFPYIPPWTIETAVLGALAAGILLVCRAPLAKQTQNEQAPPKGL